MFADEKLDSVGARVSKRAAAWVHQHRFSFFFLPEVVLCALAVSAMQPGSAADRLTSDLRFTMVGLVLLPSMLCMTVALTMGIAGGQAGMALHIHGDPSERTREAVWKTWQYERDRYRRSVSRAQFYTVEFGVTATLFLTFSALLLERHWSEVASRTGPASPVVLLAASMAAATATAFVVTFAKLLVRLSSYDISARAFSWSTRALALVVVADIGILLAATIASPTIPSASTAILVGLFTGALGEHAISLFLERAGRSLGFAAPVSPGPSPLLCIEGLLPEHVDRLQEEGIFSVHDLAFVPTPRLFFSTPYGLQMICDWQDQALLRTRWGADRARDLFEHLAIRGVLALRDVARDLPPEAHESFRRAFKLDDDALLEPLRTVIAQDEAIQRLKVYSEDCLVLQPAHFDVQSEAMNEQPETCTPRIRRGPEALPAPAAAE